MNADGSNVKWFQTAKDARLVRISSKIKENYLRYDLFRKQACPPPADYSKGYVWAIYPDYEIVTADADGSNIKQLTTTKGYDAEATVSPDGKKIILPRCETATSICIRWTKTAKTSSA
jgi:hypothetical protein